MEFCSRLAGDVRYCRNSSEALTRAGPLLNTTQLSGPEIVWWLPPGLHEGMICTP